MNGGTAASGRVDEMCFESGDTLTLAVKRRKGGDGRWSIVIEPPEDVDVIVTKRRRTKM